MSAIMVLAMALTASRLMAAPYADYVIDARTGEVLHQTNANTRLHPASLTKMMTLYIAFQAIEHGEISLDTMVTISKHAASMPPSRLGLRPGQRIALRYLIRAAAVKSANDAASAIGDAIEGSHTAFAKRMTETARAMGMTRTTFRNANGLTANGHLSTAHDMTLLGRRLFYDFPQYYGIFSRRTADAGIAQVSSTNRRFLDSYEGADGIKTGYTAPAGFNLVASAQRGNKRIIATVFGGTSTAQRNARVAELLDLGFGKAPNRARETPPPAIAYNGDAAEPDEDVVAEVIAANVDPSVPAAGKVLRLNMAVAQSPRPLARPAGPQPAGTQALTPTEEADAAIASDAADLAEATDTLMASMSGSIEAALAEANEEPVFEQTATPQPETLAMVAPEPAADPAADPATEPATDAPGTEAVALLDASAMAPAETPRPLARPAGLAPAGTEAPAAEAAVATPAPAPEPMITPPAATDAAAPLEIAALPEPILDVAPAAGDAAPGTTPIADADPGLADAIVLTPPKPARKTAPADETVVADATTIEPVAEDLEIVTRVSTSGGREWGINVGSFPSRYNAERELLRTALVEMSTLNDALRKVTSRKGAFDANFVGLTEESANLACKRLSARGTDCKVLNPAG